MQALLKEIDWQQDYLGGEPVETIYFGGGTPSLLTETQLNAILRSVAGRFPVTPGAEISFEVNPDDVGAGNLLAWKKAGINRLSMGVQSFFEEDLRWMNRAHNAEQAQEAIRLAREAQFSSLSIDLIYGSPTLSDEHWKSNVDRALAFEIPHFSCYALTVEPKTPLAKMIALEKRADVNGDDQARQFAQLMQWMKTRGYEHYEISNFALPGQRSRHNTGYWQGKKYLGLGPSAHSFDGNTRQWNPANNKQYIDGINNDELLQEKEDLTPTQRLNEYIMTSLRTIEGLDLDTVHQRFGADSRQTILAGAEKYLRAAYLQRHHESLVLSDQGKFLADGIAADLFFD